MWQIPGDAASPEIPGIPGLDFNPLSTFGLSLLNICISPLQHLDSPFSTFGFLLLNIGLPLQHLDRKPHYHRQCAIQPIRKFPQS